MNQEIDVDSIIHRLLEVKKRLSVIQIQVQLHEYEIRGLCTKAREIFLSQPMLLDLKAPITIAAGQYYDLLRLLECGGLPPETNYLFLGDYVDRGRNSIETICLLLAYKIKYPQNFFVLRGHHECASINRVYGFFDECKRRYSIKLWKMFNDCFNCLPVSAVIDHKIFCTSGGLSPDLHSMDDIRSLARPTDIPDTGLLCDLLWADPDDSIQGWGECVHRGVSVRFGPDVTTKFLATHNFHLLCRAHQVVDQGFKFFANRKGVTVFSASDYREACDNDGAIMHVETDQSFSFSILKPLPVHALLTSPDAKTEEAW